MEPAINGDLFRRVDLTKAQMEDIGWKVVRFADGFVGDQPPGPTPRPERRHSFHGVTDGRAYARPFLSLSARAGGRAVGVGQELAERLVGGRHVQKQPALELPHFELGLEGPPEASTRESSWSSPISRSCSCWCAS